MLLSNICDFGGCVLHSCTCSLVWVFWRSSLQVNKKSTALGRPAEPPWTAGHAGETRARADGWGESWSKPIESQPQAIHIAAQGVAQKVN